MRGREGGGGYAPADMISCRKFIRLSISFRSFRVSIRAKEEEERKEEELNYNNCLNFSAPRHIAVQERGPASHSVLPETTVDDRLSKHLNMWFHKN